MEAQLLELVDLLKKFEERKDISVYMELDTDCSGSVNEFWTEDVVFSFDTIPQLIKILNEATG